MKMQFKIGIVGLIYGAILAGLLLYGHTSTIKGIILLILFFGLICGLIALICGLLYVGSKETKDPFKKARARMLIVIIIIITLFFSFWIWAMSGFSGG